METVKSILAAKGSDVYSVSADALVIAALRIMTEHNIGAILVTDKGGDAVGIFSERDFARKIILKGRTCENTKVEEIMTAKVLFAEPTMSIEDCMNMMTTHHFRHLPVKENGKVIGMVSIGDVVKDLLKHKETIISQQAFEIGQNERRSSGAV